MKIQEFAEKLKASKGRKVLVLTHHNADIDAAASAIALAEGLKQVGADAKIGVAESVSRAAQKLSEGFKIIIDPDCKQFDYVVLVDTSVPEQLASVKNLRADFVIDHHPEGKLAEKAVSYIDGNAKSSAQLVYLVLKELKADIDESLAKIISAGIVADTAHFRHADSEVFSIMAELTQKIKFSDVLQLITSEDADPSGRVAALKAASRMDIYKFGEILVALSNVVSHEAAACRGMLKLGADIAIVVAEKENETRISSRAKEKITEKNLDLSEMFQEIGKFLEGSGGGHPLAGSANGKRKNRDELKKLILRLLTKKLGQWKKLE
ncbi:bifunctional oligoribonuclease/PAP phosphatase NrnA [archaeon]|nr:MAG: bifunctional oligoribonuclease/PAP phosphatase NrnA [archaeon]